MKTETIRSSSASTGVIRVPVTPADWDASVAHFDGVCQEQFVAFAQLRWPSVTLEPNLFARDGVVIGGALIMVQALPLRLGAVAIAKWAPVLADQSRPESADDYAAMVEAIKAEYAQRRGMLVSILPHAFPGDHNADYAALRRAGFRRGNALAYPDRYLVKLRLGDEEQKRSFDQTWRRQLNKSEKAGLRFEHGRADQLSQFKQLYAAMTERKQFPDFSAFDTLEALMDLPPEQRPELFFVYQGEELVAGAVIFKCGKRAVYLYGATNAAALPLRAGYFMHWRIMTWLRDHTGADWYDLGGTDGFLGLHQFKKGMVGSQGVIASVPPVVNYAATPFAYALGVSALTAREMLHRGRRVFDRFNPNISQSDQPLPPKNRQYQ